MQSGQSELLGEVAQYYSSKLAEHGETARGVDWNGPESQTLRFEQLCRILDDTCDYSLNDLGCGYGSLLDHLRQRPGNVDYQGIDVSQAMVDAAIKRYARQPNARFLQAAAPDRVADFSVASGIFNVRLERSDDQWFDFIQATLDVLDRHSHKGFAFNCLTSYSDADKRRDYLYYADPCQLFDICKRRYAKQVALLHDYGLYEFTILVRKCS
ncbi:class I SAM-dependent methyltransferase [Pseudomonas sp. NPDC089554]|uniref:class I SAM-dependent methyltransferase n=1 Tax=Pseudomonas sp. NPDC089554 TaxID=3390653 RepID=UPI003D07BD93